MASKPFSLILLAPTFIACGLATSGCECWPFRSRGCPDIEPGAMPALPGMYNAQWIDLQAQKADADRLVIHLHEWTLGGSTLGPDGKRHVARLVEVIPQLDKPILIADSDDTELNEKRRQTIIRELSERGVTNAEALLAVGVPPAEGLYGREAVRAGTQREFGGQLGNNQNNLGSGGGLGGALSGGGAGGFGGGAVGGGVY